MESTALQVCVPGDDGPDKPGPGDLSAILTIMARVTVMR